MTMTDSTQEGRAAPSPHALGTFIDPDSESRPGGQREPPDRITHQENAQWPNLSLARASFYAPVHSMP